MICIKDDGELIVQGNLFIVRSQLTALISDMVKEEIFSKDEMKKIFETALLSKEEFNSQLEEERKKCVELFGEDFVNEIEKDIAEMMRKEVEE